MFRHHGAYGGNQVCNAFIDYHPPEIIVGALDFTWTIRELSDGLTSATHECCKKKSRLRGGQISRHKNSWWHFSNFSFIRPLCQNLTAETNVLKCTPCAAGVGVELSRILIYPRSVMIIACCVGYKKNTHQATTEPPCAITDPPKRKETSKRRRLKYGFVTYGRSRRPRTYSTP